MCSCCMVHRFKTTFAQGKLMYQKLALATLIVLISASAWCSESDSFSSRVDSIFEEFDSPEVPGCAVGVIQAGQYVLAKGYGSANLEHGIPIDADSVFRIGSVSKQFTALAIAILADQGKLDLDADVHAYLPDLREYDVKVTIRQMLHHTSGIGEYEGTNSYEIGDAKPFRFGNEDYWTIEEFYQQVTKQPLALAPGERFQYSNIAYFLLSQVVESVSGQTLRQFAAKEIFAPLNMNATFFNDNVDGIVPHRADGYKPLKAGGFEIYMTNLDWVGDGGVYTSLNDLLKWDTAFMTGNVPGGEKVHEMMITADPLTLKTLGDDNSFAEQNAYGFGLVIASYKGHAIEFHGGSWVGFRAFYVRFPDDDFSVVTLCNRSDSGKEKNIESLLELAFAEFAG